MDPRRSHSRNALPFLALTIFLPACKGRFSLPADARYVQELAMGDGFACARMKDASVRCFGASDWGELGDGTRATAARIGGPSVRVTGLPPAKMVAAGGKHACAVTAEGGVYCWGANDAREVGAGSQTAQATVLPVPDLRAKSLALGAHHACALTDAGEVVCWGARDAGQLGDGVGAAASVVAPSAVRGAMAIAAGGDATCAILQGRTLTCWGRLPGREVVGATRIEGLADVIQVSLSETHVCAVRAWGGVACWGRNEEGELGDGTLTDRAAPVDVSGLIAPAQEVAVGRAHTCALLRDGTVHCWGANGASQLADGTTAPHPSPALVNGMFEVQALVAAGDATCGRFGDGSERCWGGLPMPKMGGAHVTVPMEIRW